MANSEKNLYEKILEIDSMPKEKGKTEILNMFNIQAKLLGMTYLFVEREEAENCDIRNGIRYFKKVAKKGLKGHEKTFVIFDGYDYDNRELYEIEEVRKYVQTLVKARPESLYFLSEQTETLQLFLMSLFDFTNQKPINSPTLIDFIKANKDDLDNANYSDAVEEIKTIITLDNEFWSNISIGIYKYFISIGEEEEGLRFIQYIQSKFDK